MRTAIFLILLISYIWALAPCVPVLNKHTDIQVQDGESIIVYSPIGVPTPCLPFTELSYGCLPQIKLSETVVGHFTYTKMFDQQVGRAVCNFTFHTDVSGLSSQGYESLVAWFQTASQ